MRVVVTCLILSWTGIQARDLAGVVIPDIVKANNKVLALNGAGLGKKVSIKVYVAELYLETATKNANVAILSEQAKRVVLIMLRDVDREDFVNALEKGIKRNSSQQMPILRARVDRLEESLPDLHKGDSLEFTYLPGSGTVMRGQGKELSFSGKDFADALLSVWLGPQV